jgi:hypothetical protein
MKPDTRSPLTTQAEYKRGYRDGVRFSITWLHQRAREMNDPHAVALLNTAAFNLGVDLSQGRIRSNEPEGTTIGSCSG